MIVGRTRELAELQAALDGTRDGRGDVVVLGGDAGLGKSTLLDETLRRAAAHGFGVIRGHCLASTAGQAFRPWTEALSSLVDEMGAEAVRSALGDRLAYAVHLVPGLADATASERVTGDTEEARAELFHTVGTLLAHITKRRPFAIAIEDVHWADHSSLRLLAHLAEGIAGQSLVVFASLRELEAGGDPQRASLVDAVARSGRRIRLSSLAPTEVAQLVSESFGLELSEDEAEELTHITGGNPFYVDEVMRDLGGSDDDGRPRFGDLADHGGVHAVVARRIGRLPSPSLQVMEAAAVTGQQFPARVVGRAIERPDAEVVEALDEPIRLRLVAESAGPGTYAFAHALVQETLYDRLDPVDRRELHRHVGRALEEYVRHDADAFAAELARHFLVTATAGTADQALGYSQQAAERAAAQLADEEAVLHYRNALEVLPLSSDPSRERECDLLLGLGAALRRTGESAEARRALVRSADLARALGDPDRLARAALRMEYGMSLLATASGTDREWIAHLEEALAALPAADSPLRVEVLATLAEARYWTGTLERCRELSAEAVALARRLDVPAVLARALMSRYFSLMGPGMARERADACDEIIELGRVVHDPEVSLVGHAGRVFTALDLGDPVMVDRSVGEALRTVNELRQPVAEWMRLMWESQTALLEGRLEEAEQLIEEGAKAGERVRDPQYVMEHYAIQSFVLHFERGTLDHFEPLFRAQAEMHPDGFGYRSALSLIHVEMGDTEAASDDLERFFAHGLENIPRDVSWLMIMCHLCELAVFVGTPEQAKEVIELLSPYDDECIEVSGMYAGPVSQWLGVAAWHAGDRDAARDWFEHAVTVNRRMGARPNLARALHKYGARLLTEGGDGASRGREMLSDAFELARACGMTQLASMTEELLAKGAPAAPRPAEVDPAVTATLHPEGDVWVVGLGDELARIRTTKGLEYLAALVDRPGREVHVLELASPAAAAGARTESWDDALGVQGDAGPVLDEQAKAHYRARIRELQEDLDEAEAHRDTERAARAREEMDAIAGQLSGAFGLGGRERKVGSDAERARSSVTKAIRYALKKIDAEVPRLARHLDTAVKTGVFCSYAPDPSSLITWERDR